VTRGLSAVRVGILGGTFNPPHLGHLVCAQEAYRQLDLDQVLFIPARIPPHKPMTDEPGIEHRLAMCRLVVGTDERFAVSELEVERDGPSYTVDTLSELKTRAAINELVLILGGDIAAGLPRWHQPERVLELSTPAITLRPGTSRDQIDEALSQLGGGRRARFFEMPKIGVSSTMVRDRVRGGEPIRYLVPDDVAKHIERESLYRGPVDR
jgi:nicotinate-nucleotide adenylyltransferase